MPWAGYLHRIAISDHFVLLDDVQFEKNSYTNRNRLKGPNGEVWLTVPVILKGHMSGTIGDVKIATHNKWAIKHWKSIQQSYGKAPYYKQHADFFHDIFNQNWKHLHSLNRIIIDYLLLQFNIDTNIINLSSINLMGKKQELILAICSELNADSFVFGMQGRDYVDQKLFEKAHVSPIFHEYHTKKYHQLWGDFIPNLSAIDLLFNVPRDELGDILKIGGILHRSE
jgi:hypothetical protein